MPCCAADVWQHCVFAVSWAGLHYSTQPGHHSVQSPWCLRRCRCRCPRRCRVSSKQLILCMGNLSVEESTPHATTRKVRRTRIKQPRILENLRGKQHVDKVKKSGGGSRCCVCVRYTAREILLGPKPRSSGVTGLGCLWLRVYFA